jgi:ABC-type multidrug transport system ATPase subunit
MIHTPQTPPSYNGKKAVIIPLSSSLIIGSGENADLVLECEAVSNEQAVIEKRAEGYVVTDHGSNGGLLNGRFFHRAVLIIGDRLEFGTYAFVFTGLALRMIPSVGGASLFAQDIWRGVFIRAKGQPIWKREKLQILQGAGIDVKAGQFIGILGPSGAGKTTLLKCIAGIGRPNRGKVFVNGKDLFRNYSRLSPMIGFVPQEDIVHSELTIRDALTFSARLRLPKNAPPAEVGRLVVSTVEKVGLIERIDTTIGDLSGGQRKRVNVATELLTRPELLFLDEPTSGLDPASEMEMMELLRRLADSGCTVVCTTHLMENVFLMDGIVVVLAGKTIFEGAGGLAAKHFEVSSLIKLYQQLKTKKVAEWVSLYAKPNHPQHPEQFELIQPDAASSIKVGGGPRKRLDAMIATATILVKRKMRMLCADSKGLLLLAFQPLLIGSLIAWVVPNPATSIFVAYIAAFWLGCSNAAQEIVREIAIYRRERHAGLGTHTYLFSKFGYLTAVTSAQSLLLYILAMLFGSVEGSLLWQALAVVLCAFSGVAIGLSVSAFSRSSTQAVMVVPLVLIPQLLFSGFVVPLSDWEETPSVLKSAKFAPSFHAQRLADLGQIWGKRIDSSIFAEPATAVAAANIKSDGGLSFNAEFRDFSRSRRAVLGLLAWAFAGYAGSWAGLKKNEGKG